MSKPNAIIGQSGGPTTVINSSLVGVVNAARDSGQIGTLYGMRFGIEGVLNGQFINLFDQPAGVMEGLRSL